MKVIFFSLTGNCKRFVEMCKLPEEDVIDLWEIDYEVDFDYILITPTIGFGKVPEDVERFLRENDRHLKGVVGSGNRNWGNRFAKAAEIISEQYNVPLLMKIELHGNTKDLIKFKKNEKGELEKTQMDLLPSLEEINLSDVYKYDNHIFSLFVKKVLLSAIEKAKFYSELGEIVIAMELDKKIGHVVENLKEIEKKKIVNMLYWYHY